uniref:Late embryogenesis abundant protein, LEA-3 n=1 Tax=Tanacetum cinerariifolium TaxID=118510 RepID=A0A6L2MG88_TANCI|nr:late embryogenesis abundant protein, LEA-3 [Tanacetum cinerariifolium]
MYLSLDEYYLCRSKGYEATKTKAGEGLEAAKELMGKKFNEAAEPHWQKANVITRGKFVVVNIKAMITSDWYKFGNLHFAL